MKHVPTRMEKNVSPAPIWLLDFDGVINAISSRGGRMFWDTWNTARIPHPDDPESSLPLLWSPDVVQVVADAVDAGVDVRWLTTWREHTRILPEVIPGLPVHLPWMDEDTLLAAGGKLDPMNQLGQRWKFDVASNLVPDGVPLLWTDDHLDYILAGSNRRWVTSRPGGTTLITPREQHGLYRKHVRAIREWIADYS